MSKAYIRAESIRREWANKYAALQIFKLKVLIGLLIFVWLVKS
jgi:hypothetical protein